MPANPPPNMPRITPYLYYEDVASALAWLARTFGFRERMRMPGPDGKIMHAEMEFADGVLMMGNPGPDYRNPKRLARRPRTSTSTWTTWTGISGTPEKPAPRYSTSRRTSSTGTAATEPRIPKGTSGTSRSMCATWRPRT